MWWTNHLSKRLFEENIRVEFLWLNESIDFCVCFFLVIFNRKEFFVLLMKFNQVLVEVELIIGHSNPMAIVSEKHSLKCSNLVLFCLEIVPDFVALGKSMGNGFPVAALVTRKEITNKFDDDGIEYFNTYGGNPVSCRAAIAVLDVIEQEKLQEHAHRVGLYYLNKLKDLAKKYKIIGDVRGRGLFLGIELVRDRAKREPAIQEAKYVRAK